MRFREEYQMKGSEAAMAPTRNRLRQIKTSPQRSALMSRVRQRGTAPEIVVRRIVRDLGYSFRNNSGRLPGSPDLYDTAGKWVVFVHGCFWHRHAGCRACTHPKNNAGFWQEKFAQNIARDKRNRRDLRRLGVAILTIWECQAKPSSDLQRLENRLARFLAVRGDRD
jgi:DNA mismatch endonuclease (patch repair protein)